MFLSFLIIIVFWGAFEQAGGLMSLYTEQKTDRTLSFALPLIGNEVPAAIFQSINAFFIIVLGTAVGSFWYKWARKGKESSSLFKMAIGVIIMGTGFLFMSKASTEVVMGDNGELAQKSAMIWLTLAYLFHTIGELCASPVALSFITKLAPERAERIEAHLRRQRLTGRDHAMLCNHFRSRGERSTGDTINLAGELHNEAGNAG